MIEADLRFEVGATPNTKVKKILITFVFVMAILPSFPELRVFIQESMAFHMLFQMPMLIFSGYLLYGKVYKYSPLTTFVSYWLWIYLSGLFWMLPISLDAALTSPLWDIFKITSLIVTGALLKIVLQRYKELALFFIGSTVMMLFFIGVYFQETKLRLCNAYLIESQQLTGFGLIILAFLMLLALIAMLVKTK